jgi:prolyl-tRNA synthetase
MKPRFGLIRAKEFLMKDLYTFDLDLNAAKDTYCQIQEQYDRIYSALKVPFVKVSGDTGVMGGNTSHEYHYLTSIGEDQILECNRCARAINRELAIEDGKICPKCNLDSLRKHNGIEVGHTFILEDKYTKPLKATFLNKSGKPEVLQMGCYGIGVSRVIAAAIEYLSSEKEIRWPFLLAPFKVCLIPPKVCNIFSIVRLFS